jgi:PAS domain S-box-containing protein
MKTYLKNLSIRRKISSAIFLTCGTALVIAATAILVVHSITFRRSFSRDLEAIGAILGNNSATALRLKDHRSAEEILGAVKAKSHILHASIRLADGSEFAAFDRAPGRGIPACQEDGAHFRGGYLILNQPIVRAGERIASLRLVSDYRSESNRSLRLYAAILSAVMVVSVLLTLALSDGLQRVISAPILHLAGIAQKVAEQKDYSLRAEKLAEDEVGQLTTAINQMLAKIESNDRELRSANQMRESEIAEHQRTEHALETSERFMRSLVESLPQNILRKDLAGRFTFVNEFFCRTVGKPMDQIIGKTDHDLFPQELAAKFRRDDERVIASGQQFETVEENQDVAGQKVYVQVIKTPLFDADNRAIGLQVIYWDVTARKRAEEAVEKLHKELLLTSRQAGMADVATGVLHNVGNVLNSVNVSVNVLENRLTQSRVGNLGKALALLREHRTDLAAFLRDDPKGKVLPGYLDTLADHLAAEQAEMLQEMGVLGKNVEHIKEIVAMQQNYAHLCGVTEQVQACELVEDAIRMNLGAFERHGIRIEREFDEVPPVRVDRHKVLQILVNLMRNAKYAIDELRPSDKRLAIGIHCAGPGPVAITLRDNGIGIPPENLTRIFAHGFTTKRDGHGFGLHSGALAAQEMGGRLTAHSEGTGQGATFCLELPAAQSGPEKELKNAYTDAHSLAEA